MTDSHSLPTISARADFQYRWRVYALFILLFGYGVWSAYDGFVKWPRENEQSRQMEAAGQTPPQKQRTELDLEFNQTLGIALPAIALILLVWLMYRSRGTFRLEGDTLQAPGHPQVSLDQIRSLDKSRWDRKGVAVASYQLSEGRTGQITFRDMVYDRRAMDQIVQRIEEHLAPDEAATDAAPVEQ